MEWGIVFVFRRVNLAPGSAPLISPFSCSVILCGALLGLLGQTLPGRFHVVLPWFVDSDSFLKNVSAFLVRF